MRVKEWSAQKFKWNFARANGQSDSATNVHELIEYLTVVKLKRVEMYTIFETAL